VMRFSGHIVDKFVYACLVLDRSSAVKGNLRKGDREWPSTM
jgi:hypothetical protein